MVRVSLIVAQSAIVLLLVQCVVSMPISNLESADQVAIGQLRKYNTLMRLGRMIARQYQRRAGVEDDSEYGDVDDDEMAAAVSLIKRASIGGGGQGPRPLRFG